MPQLLFVKIHAFISYNISLYGAINPTKRSSIIIKPQLNNCPHTSQLMMVNIYIKNVCKSENVFEWGTHNAKYLFLKSTIVVKEQFSGLSCTNFNLHICQL